MTEDELFRPTGNHHRNRVKCTVCGRPGYAGGSWQDACRQGHPYACSCGRKFATLVSITGHLRSGAPDHFTVSTPHI